MSTSYQHQNHLHLNDEEIKRLINIVTQFNYNPSDYPELFCKESKKLANLLPKPIKQKLTDFLKNYFHLVTRKYCHSCLKHAKSSRSLWKPGPKWV